MSASRETILSALFDLGKGVQWDSPLRGFAYSSRRLQNWVECPVQPAFYQVEHDEMPTQKTGMLSLRRWEAKWVIYQNVGKNQSSIPATENNMILDALDAALLPPPGFETQTLGGLVHHCYIEGTIFRDAGDLDGQGVMVIPIKILVP